MIDRSKIVRLDALEAMEPLKNLLNGYRRSYERIYIGVTADPERRWQKHDANGWKKMVILYEAFTPKIAQKMERDLIDYARRCNFRIAPENIGFGGEGILDTPRSNFLYLVVA